MIKLPYLVKEEEHLVALLNSFDRVIKQARDLILQGKINAFDQQRINSFLHGRLRSSRASDRPLAYKLKESTYQTYKKIGKQLLCFVYRMAYLELQPALHHVLTKEQSTTLTQAVSASRALVQQQSKACYYLSTPKILLSQQALDEACL